MDMLSCNETSFPKVNVTLWHSGLRYAELLIDVNFVKLVI